MSIKETLKKEVGIHSKTLRIILSVLIAFCIWLAAMLAAPEIIKTIRDVPIQVNIPTTMALEAVSGQDTTVTVVLDGKQYEIGNYSAENIKVVADLSSVEGAGTYEVPLSIAESGNQNYTVSSISPSTVTLTFDNQMTSEFSIETDVSGLNIPNNFVSPENEISVEPASVRVVGAESVVSRIARAVLEINFDKQVRTSQTLTENIVFYDANGRVVDVAGSAGVHPDATSAIVTVPVKKVVSLPLTLSFLNTPNAFPIEELNYTFSTEYLTVAAEESEIKNYTDLIPGYVDFKQLNLLGNSELTYDVTLPAGFTNVNGVSTVTVAFHNQNITSTTLGLKNFQVINVPSDYEVTVNNASLRAQIIGTRSIINSLSSGDFVVELDLADTDLTLGQYELPVSIYAPTKGFVWAIGDYNVSVTVKAK